MDASKIAAVIEIVGEHRISGDPRISGKWAIWDCGHSPMTMSKFVDRCKRAHYPAFCGSGKFGVLASSLEG